MRRLRPAPFDLYADEISAQPDDEAYNGHGENKEEKHNPTLITGEDFVASTVIVRRFSFPRHVLLSHVSVDEARGGPLRINAPWHPERTTKYCSSYTPQPGPSVVNVRERLLAFITIAGAAFVGHCGRRAEHSIRPAVRTCPCKKPDRSRS